jgi:hypothetical protein
VIEDFIAGLVEAALWADLQWPDREESGGGNTHYDLSDVEPASRDKLRVLAEDFIAGNEDDLDEYSVKRTYDPNEGTIWSYAGHDAWLSACGHGTGFWDRDLGELGDRLDKAATAVFGRFESSALPYVTPDNKISFI